ncbi:MAG: 6-phosphofructokinase [Clostridia bacterium]|nr:6-phosphofructokinase [Clostridia bacterium]
MEILRGNAVIGQSGGPTAAINASLAGVISRLISSEHIGKVYGMKNGIEGFLKEDLIDISAVFEENTANKLESMSHTPASALGSCRKKLPRPSDDPSFFENLISLFKKYDIRYFLYIGGNDSMDTVAKLSEYTSSIDYKIQVIGVPKTIDTDLCMTDHTPGFGSAAKYIATTVQEIIRDCSVYTVPAVTIVEIMGRDAGWLTLSAGLGRIVNGFAPDYIYLPERAFSLDSFLDDVKDALARHPNVVIAVSEGLRDGNGVYVGEGTQSGVADVFGHKYLSGTGKALELYVKEKIGCKVRSVEMNISQRCASHISSATDICESFEAGAAAADAALSGVSGCMMAIERLPGDEYAVKYVPKEIGSIANAVRCVPDEYINKEGNNVTDDGLRYVLPLIMGEVAIKWRDGLPEIFVF